MRVIARLQTAQSGGINKEAIPLSGIASLNFTISSAAEIGFLNLFAVHQLLAGA